MDKQRKLILSIIGLVVVFAAAFALGFAGRDREPPGENKVELASRAERDQQACASPATYNRMKEVLFEDALKVSSNAENLDTLAAHSVVRMENPVVKERDPARNATICSGTFVLELPPGAERAFGGQRRLTAEVDYAAQPAADGSGMVYQVNGAERIIAELANFDLQGQPYVPPAQDDVAFAEADTAPPDVLGMGGPLEPVENDEPVAAAPPATSESRASAEAAEARQRAQAERRAEARAEARERRLAEAKAERAREARAERPDREARARALARADGQRLRPRAPGRPSFNCRSARTRSERMVCESEGLAARDRQMSSMFYSALADADPRTRRELRRTRDRFLAYRERCRSEACVADAYEGRMREIDDIMVGR